MIERLPDGAQVVIRPIRAEDKRMLSDGLRRLSPESVQRRFLTPKRSFSRAELRYLTEVDGRDHVALVAQDPAEPVPHLIAVGRSARGSRDGRPRPGSRQRAPARGRRSHGARLRA